MGAVERQQAMSGGDLFTNSPLPHLLATGGHQQ
jgi:hypothetical protein